MDEQVFRALLDEFYLESKERLGVIEQLLLSAEGAGAERRAELLVEAKRELHTLKGNSAMMGLQELQTLAHHVEDRVIELGPESLTGAVVGELLASVDEFGRLLDRATGRAEAAAEAGGGEEDEASRGVQESVRVSFAALDSLVDLLSEMVIFRNRLAESLGQGLHHLPPAERQQPWWRDVEEAHETLHRTLEDLQAGIMQLRM